MKVSVTITGGHAFVGQFKLLNFAATDRLSRVVERSTKAVEAGALARVPKGTGELASTIRSRYRPDKLRGTVMAGKGDLPRAGKAAKRTRAGNAVKPGRGAYAPIVEYGSHDPIRQPEPFMHPAAEAERPAFIAAATSALSGAVADVDRI